MTGDTVVTAGFRYRGVMAPDLKYTRLSDDPDESHQKVLGLVPPSGRILEIGAATGYMTRALQAHGLEVVATELDSAAVAEAASQGTSLRHGQLLDVLQQSEWGSFDAVVAADVVEHVQNAAELLRSLRGCLRSGGHLVMSVPNVAHWTVRVALAMGRFEYTRTGLLDQTHVRFYTRSSLRELVKSAGFEIVQEDVTLGLYVYPRWRSPRFRWYQRRAVRLLAQAKPTLFGYQFIVKAQLPQRETSDGL